jgi:hypothetical protein
MKRLLPGLFVFFAACGTTSYMRPTTPTPPPGPEESKVVVYQTTRFAHAGHFPFYEWIEYDGRLLGFSQKDCYFEVRCPPGKHRFFTCGDGRAYIEAELTGGLTYYIQAYSDVGIFSTDLGFAPVSRDSEDMRKLEVAWPRLQCRELDPEKAAEYSSRRVIPVGEVRKGFEEESKEHSHLKPEDGRAEKAATPK